ncbi:MAG: Hpt domain-containing protein [Proteobacteria bacterium]|nr:MAG: Hpt domain-containing protein [Pseudomonadota bacterium]
MEQEAQFKALGEFLDLNQTTVLMGEPDDLSFLEECLGLFLRQAESDLPICRTALTANDTEQTSRAAHRLKSSAAAIGAVELAQSFSKLEKSPTMTSLQETELLFVPFAKKANDYHQSKILRGA